MNDAADQITAATLVDAISPATVLKQHKNKKGSGDDS